MSTTIRDGSGSVALVIDTTNTTDIVKSTDLLPKVVLLGDSITDQSDHGWWVDMVTDYVSFESLTNYAVGGATWSFYSDTEYDINNKGSIGTHNNVIWNQFNRLKNDVDNEIVETPDVIIILAGMNDNLNVWTSGSVADAFDGNDILNQQISSITTMAKAIRFTCESILQEYPEVQVILATPTPRASSATLGTIQHDIILGCAKQLGMKCIDQTFESGIYVYQEYTGDVDLQQDGVHPNNTTGSRKLAKFLAREFLNLINIRGQSEEEPGEGE